MSDIDLEHVRWVLDVEEAMWRYTDAQGTNTHDSIRQALNMIKRIKERLGLL